MILVDDKPAWSDSLKILTHEQLAIPHLYMLGYADYRSVTNRLQTHYHNTMEITVILNGTQQYYVDDTLYSLQGGDIFMTKPQECHGNKMFFQNVCKYFWFQLDLTPSDENFLGLMPPYDDYLYQQMLHYNQRVKKADKKDIEHLADTFYLIASPDPCSKLSGYNRFLQFMINSFCASSHSGEDAYSPDIQMSINYIHLHIRENLDINMIAEHARLSKSRFLVKFKHEVGITPHAYITSKKIEVAKDILKNRDTSITDIAYELCFSSSNHFSTVFKKYTGFSPTEYRESHPHL